MPCSGGRNDHENEIRTHLVLINLNQSWQMLMKIAITTCLVAVATCFNPSATVPKRVTRSCTMQMDGAISRRSALLLAGLSLISVSNVSPCVLPLCSIHMLQRPVLADDSFSFDGSYSDPKHPGCARNVMSKNDNEAEVPCWAQVPPPSDAVTPPDLGSRREPWLLRRQCRCAEAMETER